MGQSEIPSIDFSSYDHGSVSDRERTASAVDEALRSVGFIYLHNHGIDQRKVDTCFQWASLILRSTYVSGLTRSHF